jgi:hypothetical protein
MLLLVAVLLLAAELPLAMLVNARQPAPSPPESSAMVAAPPG